ncbi:DUF899 family protein [Streptomyces sp. NPDC086033]|uniref:DUF899 family protein n=1 Tax=Streptomyces sp. NPDC086033 TaxID=3365747 RepID=UPI0037CDCE74
MTAMARLPEVVSREEWLRARKELLAEEKEVTRARDRVNAARRRLPMVRVEKRYVFEGPHGQVRHVRGRRTRPRALPGLPRQGLGGGARPAALDRRRPARTAGAHAAARR